MPENSPRHRKKPWDHDVRWFVLAAILIVLGLLAVISYHGWR
jgi:hypothetical protein